MKAALRRNTKAMPHLIEKCMFANYVEHCNIANELSVVAYNMICSTYMSLNLK